MKKILFFSLMLYLCNTNVIAQTYCLTPEVVEITATELRVNFRLSSPSATVYNVDASFYITGTGGISGTSFVAGNAGSSYNIGGGNSYIVRNPTINPLYYAFPISNSSVPANFSVDDVTDGNGVGTLIAGVPTILTQDPGCPINNIVLPVTLLSFTASKKDDDALIEWATSHEKALKNFELLRSKDGVNFSTIATFEPQGLEGNKAFYNHTDKKPSGLNYYRIKANDTDGKFQLSKIQSVDFAQILRGSVYPNPFSDDFNLEIDVDEKSKEVVVELFDVVGKLILVQKIQNDAKVTRKLNVPIQAKTLSAGRYIVKVRSNSYNWQQKVTKQ